MSRFCFYHGPDEAMARRMRTSCTALWGDIREAARDSFRVFVPAGDAAHTLTESADVVGAVAGYVRRDNLGHAPVGGSALDEAHNRCFAGEVIDDRGWPLGSEWTGSFGAVAHGTTHQATVLCNDPIGFMPVYYAPINGGVAGGTSLIVLGRVIGADVDPVGLVQRVTPPYCNYGRRTLLRGVSRLLPGEWMKLSSDPVASRSMFDNSLCNGVANADPDSMARVVWDCLQRETALAVGIDDRVAVAMSGGWDSRLVLAGVAHRGAAIDCLTYGNADAYEPSIARRCAEAVGARHESFSIEGNYFPPRNGFETLVRETEAFNIPEWYSMIAAHQRKGRDREIILLGDHCQSIDGRYMTEFASRGARRKAFMNSVLGKREEIQVSGRDQFEHWKRGKVQGILADLRAGKSRLSPHLLERCSDELLTKESTSDLEVSLLRVHDNHPPFVAMYDELFIWFHKTRFTLASQNLLLNATFRSMSPSMSMRSVRLLSTIHPRVRLRRRLMDALARLPEFYLLGKIPSAQIPFMSARAPAPVRELAWGVRSGLDQVLIRRVMRTRDPEKRQRVLRSLDYIAEYRRDGVVPTIRDWFSGPWLDGETYAAMARQRAEMVSWPLINLDITAPANVSMILDACGPGTIA